MRLLLSFLAAFWPPAVYEELKSAGAAFAADDRSLAAERARAIGLSHRDWMMTDIAVVPIDRGDSPLPIGVQIIGPRSAQGSRRCC